MRKLLILFLLFFSFSLVNAQTGACCYTTGQCEITTESSCIGGAGAYQGDDTTCEACGDPIPTLSEWGIIGLGLALIIFGTVAVRSRKRELSS